MASANRRELKEREGEISRITPYEFEDEYDPTPIDIGDQGPVQIPNDDGETYTEVEVPVVEFMVNTDLESVTIGVGTNYDFELGKVYRAPKYIRDHLESKGYVYH